MTESCQQEQAEAGSETYPIADCFRYWRALKERDLYSNGIWAAFEKEGIAVPKMARNDKLGRMTVPYKEALNLSLKRLFGKGKGGRVL